MAANLNSDTLVIYHANCADGFCAAWLLWRLFPTAQFHAAHYGTEPPDCTDKKVWVVDFCYPLDAMTAIACSAASLTVIDHHKTAAGTIEALRKMTFSEPGPVLAFDVEKSGAALTWEYLNPEQSPPWLVRYVQDRDLWKWELPDSRAINANLRSFPFDFAVWDTLNGMSALTHDPAFDAFVAGGEAILRAAVQQVAAHVRNAREITLAGHKVLCVNATVLMSEIGQELCKDRPFSATYFDRNDGSRVWSLRSDAQGIDVSDIAKQFGGGGHPRAAGFEERV